MKLGIRTKLLSAFALSSLLALLAGIVGWFGFANIADNQQKLIQGAIPAMVNVQNLAELTAKIATTATSLVQAKTQKDRINSAEALNRYKTELKISLAHLPQNGFDHKTVTALGGLVGTLLQNLKQQEALVNTRAELSRKRDVISTGLLNAVVDIGQLLSLGNAAEFSGVPQGVNPEPLLQNFPPKDLGLSKREFSSLKVESVRLVGVINQLSRETDLIVMNYLKSEFVENLNSIEKRVKRIGDAASREKAEELLQLIIQNSKTLNENNVFEVHRNLRKVNILLRSLERENHSLVIELNREVGDLINKGQNDINSEMIASEGAMILGRNIFVFVTIGTILSVALILWFYVGTAARRLKDLERGMHELAKGNYEIEVNIGQHGHDELALMADAILVFKENVIAKEQLEKEQRETEESLRRHKDNLEKLVEARTKEVLEVNRELAQKAVEHLEARNQAESASKVKTDFLATMSHELRTPMSGLLGVINLIRDTRLSEQQDEYLNTLEVISNTLLEILDDILGYSQIDAGKLIVANADFDINAVVGDMVAVLKPVADKKNIYLCAEIASDVPRMLYGDAGKLRQILLNIIGNGIKFTSEGGVRLKVVRQPGSDGREVRLLFRIEDTGIGIPKKIQNNVFEAFNQGMIAISQQYGGTGLGLAICKRLVTLLGGEINCSSRLGVGSEFFFELPFTQSQGAAELENKSAGDTEPGFQCVEKLNILLAEDDPTNRMVLRTFLEKANHKVTEAEDGEEAAILAADHDFDVVLMDLRMPKVGGIEAAKRIRALHSQRSAVPIIAISAHTNPKKIGDFASAGMNGFMAKPVDPAKLDKMIYQVVVEREELVVAQPSAVSNSSPCGEGCYDLLLQDVEFIGFEKTKAKIDLFLETSRQTLDEIFKAFKNGDRKVVHENMHKLKGAASAVGLYPLSAQAGELEALVFNELEDFGGRLETFQNLYDLSCDLLVKSFGRVEAKFSSK